MATARQKAAMTAAKPEAPAETTVTNPVRALLLDIAEVIARHANAMPLTLNGNNPTPAEVDVPWDEGPPPQIQPAAEAAPAAPAKKATKAAPRKAAPAPAPEPAEAEELTREQYQEQLEAMTVEELRALAISMDWEEAGVKNASSAEIIGALVGEKFGEAEEPGAAEVTGDVDDLGEPEGEAEEGVSHVTREELVEMNLPTLRQLAKGLEIPEEQYKGLDIDMIADLIMKYQAGEVATEGEAEEEYWTPTRAELEEYSRADLWKLATAAPPDGYGYNPPKSIKSADLITLLLEGPTEGTPGF